MSERKLRILTKDLTEIPLNWIVAELNLYKPYGKINKSGKCELVWIDDYNTVRYSTDWGQAGPIIERERIGFQCIEGKDTYLYQAWSGTCIENAVWPSDSYYAEGPTPLIAAMRCFVTSKLGDVVEVPEFLIKGN